MNPMNTTMMKNGMDNTKNTKIDGYDVSLIIDNDESSCTVGSQDWEFSNTLDSLLSYAELVNKDYTDSKTVPQKTIDKIEKWAINNGY